MKPHDAPLQPAQGANRVDAIALREGQASPTVECVADEVPVAFEVNGIAHTVMLATPAALEDFALGFMLSEGLIDSRADLLDVDAVTSAEGITLQLQITQRCLHRFKEVRRTMAGRTGCGLCGSESLAQVVRPLLRPVAFTLVDASAIASAMVQIGQRQTLQQATGATHAAAWCALDGSVQLLREDVGRHNALDKLIGAMAGSVRLPAVDPATGFIAVTSRASFEMVHKTANAGVGLLAAISAPTSLAIRTAEAAGLTLAGFVRGRNAVLYSHAERVRCAGTPESITESSTMDPQNLISMANRIGSFFEAMPDRTEARDGVATHIRKFWEPRMRRQILAALDSSQGAELSALVTEALRHHRTTLQPPA